MIFFFRTFIEVHRMALKSDINGGFSKVRGFNTTHICPAVPVSVSSLLH